MRWRIAVSLVLSLSLPLLAGCGQGECADVFCGPCPVPLTLRVADAETGGPVGEVEVEGGQAMCDAEGEVTLCAVGMRRGAGDYALTLAAPGYATREVDTEVPPDSGSGDTCCSCGYEPVTLDVTLTPL